MKERLNNGRIAQNDNTTDTERDVDEINKKGMKYRKNAGLKERTRKRAEGMKK
jgi:hypothetical protein